MKGAAFAILSVVLFWPAEFFFDDFILTNGGLSFFQYVLAKVALAFVYFSILLWVLFCLEISLAAYFLSAAVLSASALIFTEIIIIELNGWGGVEILLYKSRTMIAALFSYGVVFMINRFNLR
jgi:hypothetical protein